jgi:hypothetical protein
MTGITTTPTSTGLGDGLTAAIRQEHEAASTAARSALQHALECGRLLAEAKQAIPHGSWEAYVKDACSIAPRTASLYLRLHRHRDRLPNRQRAADLSVRQAARLLERPRAKAEPELPAAERFDYLGEPWATVTATGVVWNPKWKVVPFPLYECVAPVFDANRPAPPAWYSPGHRHVAEHESGWCFEVSPDPFLPDRVNAIAHDPAGALHLAVFDGMSPAGIVPFLTACERHHGMPSQGAGWIITTATVPKAIARLAQPFPLELLNLASRRGHRCCLWALVDEATGAVPMEADPGFRAWGLFGRALGAWVKSGEGGIDSRGLAPRRRKAGASA